MACSTESTRAVCRRWCNSRAAALWALRLPEFSDKLEEIAASASEKMKNDWAELRFSYCIQRCSMDTKLWCWLTNPYKKDKRNKDTRNSKKAKGLNARQKREMKVFQIKPEQQRYELFLPLHDLWRQYIIDVCHGLKPSSSPQFVQQKLLKADFHGAIITVVRSKCPSYVGTTGILVQEFKHVFKIITKEDRLKVIPKRNSVFAVEINGFVSHIYGSKFEQRSSERSAKKFKVKGTIDL
ncbi:ribonuclease P protein subunit p29-like [Diretmus argenteus]